VPFKPVPARIILQPAKESARVLIVRRKPSKWVHIMIWDTATDSVEHGSWFYGNFDFWGCDLSFDGTTMVYGAQNTKGWASWTGICTPPWLKTSIDVYSRGNSGAYWSGPNTLSDFHPGRFKRKGRKDWFSLFEKLFPSAFGARATEESALPFQVEPMSWKSQLTPLPSELVFRLERDGWRRRGPMPRELGKWNLKSPVKDDAGWAWRFSLAHPELLMFFEGYVESRGYVFSFSMPEQAKIIDEHVQWATYTSRGDLLVARGERIERYSPKALTKGKPDFVLNTQDLQPPRTIPRTQNAGDKN
jgi:hypothetical protein